MTRIFDTAQDEKHLRIIAHRGTTVFAPENTLASFEYAGKHRAWAIETDLRLTKDNEIVCIHDAVLDTRYNASGAVRDFTLAELKRLTAKDNGFTLPTEMLRIPTLAQYLDICEKYGAIPFIEIKDEVVEPTVELLRAREIERFAVISSSQLKHLEQTRELSGELFIHHIFSKADLIDRLAELGNSGAAYNYPDLDKLPSGLIDLAHKSGLKVCLRAGDTTESVRRMLSLGLDYIPSNRIFEI